MEHRLAGMSAVVTGASRGIGAAIAVRLAAEGASVVVNYASSRQGADNVVERITSEGGRAVAAQADLSRPVDVQRLFAEAHSAFGRLDILVNNAGIYELAPLEEVTPEHFHRQFNLNVLGLILASQEAARRFGPGGGSIVNISSSISRLLPPNSAVYSSTKAAVDAITVVLARELGPRRIRVNAINPGMIETEGIRAAGLDEGDMRKWVETTAALGRVGQVDDIAPAVAFLASPEAAYITGEMLHISGGLR
jgi:3-oxoacyl-[acyl-carrier protein] reductase